MTEELANLARNATILRQSLCGETADAADLKSAGCASHPPYISAPCVPSAESVGILGGALPYGFVVPGVGLVRTGDVPASIASSQHVRCLAALHIMEGHLDADSVCAAHGLGGGAFPVDTFYQPSGLTSVPEAGGVYFFKRGNRVVYVGESGNLRVRLASHWVRFHDDGTVDAKRIGTGNILWINMMGRPERRFAVELEMIRRMHPRLNVQGRASFPVAEPGILPARPALSSREASHHG